MKLCISIVSLVLIFTSHAYTQYMDICWPLGYTLNPRANLNFSSGSLVIDTISRNMKLYQSNASISDSLGNLLAVTNGCYISNVTGDTMQNGSGLNPGPCTSSNCTTGGVVVEGNIILPNPSNPNQYYLFHEACNTSSNQGNPTEFYSSIIDLSLDSGRGSVLYKNTIIHTDSLIYADLMAVKHANGYDWWILVNKWLTNTHITFLLDSIGVQGPFFQSYGNSFDSTGYGNSKFSPDGSWYASSVNRGSVYLFNFNRCDGKLSNFELLLNPDTLFSFVEFSTSSNYLYLISPYYIYQFDLSASNINNSRLLISTFDGYTNPDGFGAYFWSPQLAQDKKIYIAAYNGQTVMHVINYPDSLGTLADVQQHIIQLPCLNFGTIPILPNYRLGALPSSICDSINTIKELPKEFFELSPNPCTDFLIVNITTQVRHSGLLRIYNSMGQHVYSQNINPEEKEFSIEVSGLRDGVYFISVESENSFTRRAFVKLQ